MDYLIVTLTAVVAVIGVFYAKDNSLKSPSPVGYIIIFLILAGAASSMYSTYAKDKAAESAAAQAAQPQEDTRRAQAALMMQYIDLDRPFDYANITFSIVDPENDKTAVDFPFGKEQFGLFRLRRINEFVGQIVYSPEELPQFSFKINSAGEALQIDESNNEPTSTRVNFGITRNATCLPPLPEDCFNERSKTGRHLFVEVTKR